MPKPQLRYPDLYVYYWFHLNYNHIGAADVIHKSDANIHIYYYALLYCDVLFYILAAIGHVGQKKLKELALVLLPLLLAMLTAILLTSLECIFVHWCL